MVCYTYMHGVLMMELAMKQITSVLDLKRRGSTTAVYRSQQITHKILVRIEDKNMLLLVCNKFQLYIWAIP